MNSIKGLTSIIIPTYNHGSVIVDAIESALAQTAPVDVVIVDDGSTDDTAGRCAAYGARVRYFRIDHAGPCAARNRGIAEARGEFLMFLDADDVIAPTKVAVQIAAMDPEIGWTMCDVRIEDEVAKRVENASRKYHYSEKGLGAWIKQQLIEANFIPIMAPLVRRSVLGDAIRFRDERIPEDWHFWIEVAAAARFRFVPAVLATYRHRKTGRSRIPKAARAVTPYFEQPRRLNLGCGVQGTDMWHPLKGFVNLDASMGWRFEDGLPEFPDGTVYGITVSHVLMYVQESEWPRIFSEIARVLAPGGVLRITEDDTVAAGSSRRGGWRGSDPAITLTDPAKLRRYMERAGLLVRDVKPQESHYRDLSLCQAYHGDPPDVFHIEGIRECAVLFSPHSDDEALFASFTILRHRPRVVICYPSSGDYGDTATRIAESRDAGEVLGAASVDQWDGGDLVAQMREMDRAIRPTRVFAPAMRASHPDHVAVAMAAGEVFGDRLTTYQTYVGADKIRDGREVPFEPRWVQQKLRALARYRTQLEHPRAVNFFLDDLREYYGSEARS